MDRSIHICSGGDHKKTAQVDCKSLHNSTILSVTIFEKTSLLQILTDTKCMDNNVMTDNQLFLFD